MSMPKTDRIKLMRLKCVYYKAHLELIDKCIELDLHIHSLDPRLVETHIKIIDVEDEINEYETWPRPLVLKRRQDSAGARVVELRPLEDRDMSEVIKFIPITQRYR